MFNTKSGLSNLYKSFKLWNLLMQNSYCDHRNFDSVNYEAFTLCARSIVVSSLSLIASELFFPFNDGETPRSKVIIKSHY